MKNRFFIIVIVLLTIGIVVSNVALCDTPSKSPLIGEDDVYVKNIKIGEPGSFKWTVFRNSSLNYVVRVTVSGFEKWDQSVSPSYFVLDEKNPYEIVSLDFKIPNYPEKEIRDAKIVFTFRELNQTSKYIVEKNVRVKVIGVTPTGGENTIIGGFRNPLPPPLNVPFGAFLLNITIWFLIAMVIYILIKTVIFSFAKKTKTKLDDIIVQIIKKAVLVLVLTYGLIHSLLKLNIEIGFRTTLYQIYMLIAVVIGVYVSYKIFDAILNEITVKKGGRSSTFGTVLKPVFEKIGLIVIIIGGLTFGFSAMGIEVTALLAGAGVIGLVVAFAAQDTLSNFFSGMHLLLDRPFKIGDIIMLESGEYCRVESIGMRSTKLYSLFDHEVIILPNNAIANQKIVNVVKPDTRIKKRVEVGVAYGSDLEKVKKILYEAARGHPNVISEKGYEPVVRFTKFDDSSLNFRVIFWVDDIMNQWRVTSDIRAEIDARFREANIEIPFPQRTV